MQETLEPRVPSLDQEDPLEEGTATHSSVLARRIPMGGGLQSTGSQTARHDWSDLAQRSTVNPGKLIWSPSGWGRAETDPPGHPLSLAEDPRSQDKLTKRCPEKPQEARSLICITPWRPATWPLLFNYPPLRSVARRNLISPSIILSITFVWKNK